MDAYEQGKKDAKKGLTLTRSYYTVSQQQAYKLGQTHTK